MGQTVAAAFQPPNLFMIANDLTKMQILANIDEADVGKVRPGLDARFTVDAYPGEPFTGRIRGKALIFLSPRRGADHVDPQSTTRARPSLAQPATC